MQRISVICASPPHFNPGMHCVDLAFSEMVRRHQIPGKVEFYCLPGVEPAVMLLAELPFGYKNTLEHLDEIVASDVIVYWGDFLHNRHFLFELAGRIAASRRDLNNEQLLDMIYRCCLLEHIDGATANIVIFGGNVLVLDTVALADHRYVAAANSLFRKASLVATRDIHSAFATAHLSGDYVADFRGVDCAFLLPADSALTQYRRRIDERGDRQRVGVFFGRSWYYEPCFRFATMMCSELQTRGVWLPWFHDTPWPLKEKFGDAIDTSLPFAGFSDTISYLEDCSLIITDAYHLCVSAWSRGIPAICIGRGVGAPTHSTDDKKKEILYQMLGASNLYVYSEQLLIWSLELDVVLSEFSETKTIAALRRSVESSTEMAETFSRIDRSRATAERRLVEALSPA
jgi:hypothetical protein